MNLFARKRRVIPTFGISIKESLEELYFDPDIIAKFEFPETPPWTYPTAMVNLTLSYAQKDQTDPSKYISLHNEVKDVFQDYDFIYTDGSVSDDKAAAAAAVIDNYSSNLILDVLPLVKLGWIFTMPKAVAPSATKSVCLGHMFDLAKARQKPLLIHCRKKQEEDYNVAMEMLWEEKMVEHPIHRHCFFGTVPQLGEWAEFLPNCMFGIAAKSLNKPVQREVIKRTPPHRLLLEMASTRMLRAKRQIPPGSCGTS